MFPTCKLCGFELTQLAPRITICRRCDTSAQNNGMRVGPPNTPGTHNGWFTATFGDHK
jgi:hypothetical protein